MKLKVKKVQNQPFLDDRAYPSYLRCANLRVKDVFSFRINFFKVIRRKQLESSDNSQKTNKQTRASMLVYTFSSNLPLNAVNIVI